MQPDIPNLTFNIHFMDEKVCGQKKISHNETPVLNILASKG